ncbi:hypothetical protein BDW22DRAFT_809940 [Trametopsis cervina]|nr:hypothetical protein BDW22DRAFT_809940 [Trametopsis cervina]
MRRRYCECDILLVEDDIPPCRAYVDSGTLRFRGCDEDDVPRGGAYMNSGSLRFRLPVFTRMLMVLTEVLSRAARHGQYTGAYTLLTFDNDYFIMIFAAAIHDSGLYIPSEESCTREETSPSWISRCSSFRLCPGQSRPITYLADESMECCKFFA